jgi:hypothetical protein
VSAVHGVDDTDDRENGVGAFLSWRSRYGHSCITKATSIPLRFQIEMMKTAFYYTIACTCEVIAHEDDYDASGAITDNKTYTLSSRHTVPSRLDL